MRLFTPGARPLEGLGPAHPVGGSSAQLGKPLGPSGALKDGAHDDRGSEARVLPDRSPMGQGALGPGLPSPPPSPSWALLCPQGTYVLQDNSFPLLIRMASGLQYLEEAPKVGKVLGLDLPLFPQPPPQGGLPSS